MVEVSVFHVATPSGERSHIAVGREGWWLPPRVLCTRAARPWRRVEPEELPPCRLCEEIAMGLPAGDWPEGITRSRARRLPASDPFSRSAVLYADEAGWDSPPLELEPGSCRYVALRGGRLVGFVIVGPLALSSRPSRAVLHAWCAVGARRTGVATSLCAAAEEDEPITHLSGPFTPDGAAFSRSRPGRRQLSGPARPLERRRGVRS